MVDEPRHLAIPPWKCADHWSQMVTAFNRISARRRVRLHPTRMLALEIGQKLEAVNGSIDMLCNVTCVCCNDICCKKATVWYDFRDLLYLHLSLGIMPAEQIDKKKTVPAAT